MKEYRILYGCGGRAKVSTVDSEELLELKVLFNIGSKILFDKVSSQNIEEFKALSAESFFVYNRFSSGFFDSVSYVKEVPIYGPFYIVKRKADGSLDSLSLSDIRSLTKNMALYDSPFVKFCRISPRGHAARHEQVRFLSSLLNNVAVKETVEYCVDKVPESTSEMVKEFIIEKVRLLLDEMVK